MIKDYWPFIFAGVFILAVWIAIWVMDRREKRRIREAGTRMLVAAEIRLRGQCWWCKEFGGRHEYDCPVEAMRR